VDDGSRDASATLLQELAHKDIRVACLHLSRNFGHQAAICAGLDRQGAEAVALWTAICRLRPDVIETGADAA